MTVADVVLRMPIDICRAVGASPRIEEGTWEPLVLPGCLNMQVAFLSTRPLKEFTR